MMKLRRIGFVTGALICVLFAPVITHGADDWVAISDPAELRAIYSDKTFNGTFWDGSTFVAHYAADGRGILVNKGVSTPRTWKVTGNDQVCVADVMGTNCFAYWRHRDKKNVIKGMHVVKGWTYEVTVEDGIPKF